jgi:hypothetical protein
MQMQGKIVIETINQLFYFFLGKINEELKN